MRLYALWCDECVEANGGITGLTFYTTQEQAEKAARQHVRTDAFPHTAYALMIECVKYPAVT